ASTLTTVAIQGRSFFGASAAVRVLTLTVRAATVQRIERSMGHAPFAVPSRLRTTDREPPGPTNAYRFTSRGKRSDGCNRPSQEGPPSGGSFLPGRCHHWEESRSGQEGRRDFARGRRESWANF